ncbi:MAG: membrane protein insertion efficiency factor YidD [Bacteroides sp.]|nr:membrane protein insertion efficiency factor YidD [Bacteroides sp.]
MKRISDLRTPDEIEQNTAENYCLHRPLHRPKTNIVFALIQLICFEGIVVVVSLAIHILLAWLGGSSFEKSLFLLIYYMISILFLVVFSKRILILLIELYQHYAPEEVRRKCILMPTCSEYALLALRKYGVIRGMYKTYIRLTRRCKGSIYSMDYP